MATGTPPPTSIELERRREILRKVVTPAMAVIDEELKKEAPDKNAIRNKWSALESKIQRLKEYDDSIVNAMLTDGSEEDDIISEETGVMAYDEQIADLKNRTEALFEIERSEDAASSTSSYKTTREFHKSYKPPKFKIMEFDGKISNWLQWWNQFKGIHESNDLLTQQKFQHLVQCIKPDSRAAKLLAGYPQVDASGGNLLIVYL